MSGWKQTTLGEVLAPKGYVRGPFGSALRRNELLSEGVPVYEQQHAIYGVREFRFFVSSDKYHEMRRFETRANDLIISCSGTVGKVSIIRDTDPNGIISQALLLLRANTDIVQPEYLQYFFSSNEGYNAIVSRSSGSVQVNISKRAVIEQIPINLPSLDEQKAIVAILGALNDKIENNTKINNHLEQMAQAIFVEQCSDGETALLSDILDICYGKDHKRLSDGEIPCYGSGGIMRFVNEALYRGESILIPRKGSLNNVLYINEPFWTVDTMFYTHMTRSNVAKFVYFTVRNLDLAGMNVGSAVPSMTTAVLNALEVTLPSDETLASFEKTVNPMFLQIQENNAESARLVTLRDALLPKLMSGELSVTDADAK